MLFIQGFLLGLSVAAPVGPIGLICIRRTISEGRAVGFASGLGAATADAAYGLIAALGVTSLQGVLLTYQTPVRLIGAAYLCWLGVQTWRATPPVNGATASGTGLLAAWTSTLLLTLANPATIMSFAAMFGAIVTAKADNSAALLVSGVFLGSAAWWLVLSFGVNRLRSRLSPMHLKLVNRIAGVVLLGFAAWAVATLGIGASS